MLTTLLAIAVWLLVLNRATFVLFRHDKRAAVAGRRRVPERAFYTLALLGGVPAILWGAEILRHKTRKQPFRAIVFAILVLQVGAAGCLVYLATFR